MKITKQKIIKVIFMISNIYLMYIWNYRYIVGFIFGMVLMAYLILFPSPKMISFMGNMFNYNESTIKKMKENEKKQEKYRVKFKE